MLVPIVLAFCSAAGFGTGNIFIRAGTQRLSGPTATSFGRYFQFHRGPSSPPSWDMPRRSPHFRGRLTLGSPSWGPCPTLVRACSTTLLSAWSARQGLGPFASLQPRVRLHPGLCDLERAPRPACLFGDAGYCLRPDTRDQVSLQSFIRHRDAPQLLGVFHGRWSRRHFRHPRQP